MFDVAKIRWLGHASFELLIDGKTILIDPWVNGNPASPLKGLGELTADIVIVTHDHGDHGFDDAVEICKRTGASFVAIYEIASRASEKGVKNTIGMNIGGPAKVGELEIALTQAFHSGTANPTGVVVMGKELRVYHAGDTGLFGDMKLIGEIYKPDVALLPIGSHFTMGPIEAAYAAKLINPKIVIPMHYGTFPVLVKDPEQFIEEMKRQAPYIKIEVLKPGESLEL